MGSESARGIVLKAVPKPTKKTRPKTARVSRVNDAYRRWVGSLPCIVPGCGKQAPIGGENDPHHPRGLIWGTGTGLKASDYYCIPLCHAHHNLYHDKGAVSSGLPSHGDLLREFWRRYGCPDGFTTADIP